MLDLTLQGKFLSKADWKMCESLLKELNQHSVSLTAVDEREIIEITIKCKNKKSTDCDDIDIIILKKGNYRHCKTIIKHL